MSLNALAFEQEFTARGYQVRQRNDWGPETVTKPHNSARGFDELRMLE
jgi:hypothetical protein